MDLKEDKKLQIKENIKKYSLYKKNKIVYNYQTLHLHMNTIHELIVQIFPILIELLQRAYRSTIFRYITEYFHSISCWFLREMMSQVWVVHGDVVV